MREADAGLFEDTAIDQHPARAPAPRLQVHAVRSPPVDVVGLVPQHGGRRPAEVGAVFLDPEMTSPFAFYQYFLNQADADVVALLKVFSFRSREEIAELEAAVASRPEARDAQRALAEELTAMVHGPDEAARAVAASEAVFGSGDLAAVDERTLAAALADLPQADFDGASAVLDLLVATGLAQSRGDARRTVSEGGAYINNRRVTDPAYVPGDVDFLHGRWLILRRGKRNLAVVKRGR